MKRPKNFQELVTMVLWLQDQLLGIRLDRKQLMQRYGWSEATLDRRIADGTVPIPMRLGGRPYWTLLQLSEVELTGRLPAPLSA